eukprot:11226680-Lingulodinium_polyedra.AAC.1
MGHSVATHTRVTQVNATEYVHDPVGGRGEDLVLHGAHGGGGGVPGVAHEGGPGDGVQRPGDARAL